MNWLFFAFGATFFYSLFDLFLKLSSNKMHSGLNGLIVNMVANLILVVFVIISKLSGEKVFEIKPGGMLYAILAGIAIGFASIFFIKLFATGTNLSVGVPIVRIGMVIIAVLLGSLFLKEQLSIRFAIGLVLSVIGLYLVITR